MINNPYRQIRPKEKPFYGQSVDPYQFLRVGKITRVDNEMNNVSVEWLDYGGGFSLIPITYPFSSSRSFLGGMPSIGSIVLCGFTKQTQTTGQAQIINYITAGYRSSLWYLLDRGNFETTKLNMFDSPVTNETYDSFIKEKIDHSVTRWKRRKIYSGEINGESEQGSEFLLDENITFISSGMEEIQLRSADHHIINNSVNHTIITGATKIKNGMITRNLDDTGKSITDIEKAPFKQYVVLPNGKKLFVVTTDYKNIDSTDTEDRNQSGGGAFNEFRTEVYETSTNQIKITEETSGTEVDYIKPFITQVLGTNVGNDHTERLTYGKILRPRIFQNPEDNFPSIGDDVVSNEINRLKSIATCYELKFDNQGLINKDRTDRRFYNQTKFSVDKQGHVFINISASSNDHPFGAGRSLEFNSDGSLKFVIGMNTAKMESILMNTKGGIRFYVGKNIQKRSIDATLDSALYMTIKAGDENGIAMSSNITGNVTETIRGNKTLNIDGNYTVIVTGVIDERIKATKTETFVKDKYTNFGGDFIVNVLGKHETSIATSQKVSISGDLINSKNIVNSLSIISGSMSEKINIGNRTINLLKGDFEDSILFGNRKLNITSGNYIKNISSGNDEETLTLGDKKISLTAGNYQLDISTGDITIKTSVGSVTISGSSDISVSGMNITLDATSTNKIISQVLASIDSAVIKLGGDSALQPAVLGYQLLSWLATHTHMHPFGPTLTPIVPPSLDILSKVVFVK